MEDTFMISVSMAYPLNWKERSTW